MKKQVRNAVPASILAGITTPIEAGGTGARSQLVIRLPAAAYR